MAVVRLCPRPFADLATAKNAGRTWYGIGLFIAIAVDRGIAVIVLFRPGDIDGDFVRLFTLVYPIPLGIPAAESENILIRFTTAGQDSQQILIICLAERVERPRVLGGHLGFVVHGSAFR